MTVTVSYSPLTYNCNGSTTAFSVTWPFFLSSDLVVTHITSGGVETTLALTTDYTVTGGRDSTTGLPAVGTVTTLSTYASGVKIRISRSTPKTQSTSFTTAGAFPAKTVEAMIDRVHMIAEEGGAGSSTQDIDGSVMMLETGAVDPDYWDGQGYAMRNLADPTEDDDAATRSWVQSQITLATIADMDFTQAGTGAVGRTWQAKMRDFVSVKDFGALGDGSTDDTTAIQAAFNSGAKKICFPAGRYITGALTVPNWLHIVGEAYQPTIAPSSAAVILNFTLTSGVALTCGYNPTFENICFLNSGGTYNETTKALSGTTASAISLTDNITLEFCTFALWSKCILFGASPYYIKTNGVEFNRCTSGYVSNGTAPYDVDIRSPISRLTTNFFLGETAHPARNVKIHGGSIEGYSSVASGVLDLSIFGTYFETITERNGAFAIDPGVNGAAVSLFGCLCYMNYTNRFVNMSALTGCALTSKGNQFAGTGPSGAICFYLPSTGVVSLSGDLFESGHPNDVLYVDSVTNAGKFNGITMPILPSGNTQASYSGINIVGSKGFTAIPLTAAPSVKPTGLTVMADGSSWDPLSLANARPYWVTWQGDVWKSGDGGSVTTGTIKTAGKETIFIPAGAMVPRVTNGASAGTVETSSNKVMMRTLDFDTTTKETVGFWVAMPASWNESTVTFQVLWTAGSGSGGVAWGLAAYSFSDGDSIDTAAGGQQIVTDTFISANTMHITSDSSAITISGTPLERDAVYFELSREVSNGSDTLGVDARLIGLRLFYTTNAANDG